MTLVLNGSNDIFFNSESKDILITPQTRLKASQVGARPGGSAPNTTSYPHQNKNRGNQSALNTNSSTGTPAKQKTGKRNKII
jgi:hypothetical protein